MQPLSKAPEEYQKVILEALESRKNAYCQYSEVQVGAALLGTNNKIYQGCNIENVSYGLTICAERTALFKAISEGQKDFKMIAINSSKGPITPCGACRQTLAEFCIDLEVYLVDDNYNWKHHTLKDLLPNACKIKGLNC